MIVFGWYSWAIRNYMPHELGLNSAEYANLHFEVRQKCFHLFWIPFFSIGKMYVMKKEGKMYEVTPEFAQYMRSLQPHKTPWYAFLGLILIPVCYLLYLGNEKYEDYKSVEYRKEYIAAKLDKIDNPQIHDFYEVLTTDYNRCIMRVENFTKDSIQIGMPSVLSDENRNLYRGVSTMNEYFDNLGSQLWTAWIAKSDLKQAINQDATLQSDFKGKVFPELLETDSFMIDDIERVGN